MNIRYGQFRRFFVMAAALGTLACAPKEESRAPLGPDVPARRAASSFVHCLEQAGGVCVTYHQRLAAWDAFEILGWMGSGSPVALLQALPRELDHHLDLKGVQARFVNRASRLREPIRGAECAPKAAFPLGDLITRARKQAEERLKRLGLWGDEMKVVLDDLDREAQEGLREGYLVRLDCYDDPYRLFIATAPDGDRYLAVGMLNDLPRHLGGEAPDRETVEGRLRSRSLGSVSQSGALIQDGMVDSDWLPIPVEVF